MTVTLLSGRFRFQYRQRPASSPRDCLWPPLLIATPACGSLPHRDRVRCPVLASRERRHPPHPLPTPAGGGCWTAPTGPQSYAQRPRWSKIVRRVPTAPAPDRREYRRRGPRRDPRRGPGRGVPAARLRPIQSPKAQRPCRLPGRFSPTAPIAPGCHAVGNLVVAVVPTGVVSAGRDRSLPFGGRTWCQAGPDRRR